MHRPVPVVLADQSHPWVRQLHCLLRFPLVPGALEVPHPLVNLVDPWVPADPGHLLVLRIHPHRWVLVDR